MVHSIPLRDPPLPASSASLPSSPFHQGLFMSSVPHNHQVQYDWPSEEYYPVENLFGVAQFDLPPFRMLPTANRRPSRSSTNSGLLRQLDPLMLHADQSSSSSSSVRTYRVRPQRGDVAEFLMPAPPEHQERAHDHHGLLAKDEASATLPAREAPGRTLQSQMESHLTARTCVGAPDAGTRNSNDKPPAARPRKTRIRWTQDRHERFVECVNQLGGADKATPRAILRLMSSGGLTIYHIKSHLQKYRTQRCMPPPSSPSEGQQHEKCGDTQNPESKIGMHIAQALRIQLHMQRRLYDQLEMQRRLQVRIEEQGKRLQKMFEDQRKASGNNAPPSSQYHDDDFLFPAATAEQDEYDAVFVDTNDDEMQLMSVGSYDDEF